MNLYEFIQSFQDRLDEEVIEDLLEEIEFNEFENAFNILIDRLYVFEVKISVLEWEKIVEFAKNFNYEESYYLHLKSLVVS